MAGGQGKYYQKWHFDLCPTAFAARGNGDAANKSRGPTGQRLDATFKLLPANKDCRVDTDTRTLEHLIDGRRE